MEGDGLPSQVCLQCVHYINRAFSFKQLCERSDATLRQYLGKSILTEISTKDIIPLVPVQILEATTETEPQQVVPQSIQNVQQVQVPEVQQLQTQVFIPIQIQEQLSVCKDEVLEPKIEILDNSGNEILQSRKFSVKNTFFQINPGFTPTSVDHCF